MISVFCAAINGSVDLETIRFIHSSDRISSGCIDRLRKDVGDLLPENASQWRVLR